MSKKSYASLFNGHLTAGRQLKGSEPLAQDGEVTIFVIISAGNDDVYMSLLLKHRYLVWRHIPSPIPIVAAASVQLIKGAS